MSIISNGNTRGLDVPAGVPDGPHLRRTVNFEQAVGIFGRGRVEEIAAHHNIGDELGYAAYKALAGLDGGPARGQGMFDQALADGIDSVDDAPVELKALFTQVDTVPDWVDWDQLQRGSVAYWRRGKLTVMSLAYAAIGAGFRTYGGSRPLVLSRRLIERDQVGRRLVETLRWAANASKPDGMRRDGDGFRLTMNVRFIHGAVRHHMTRSEHWRWDDWGLVVANTDSIYTMGTLFTENVIDALGKVGIKLTAREIDDIVALWRYIGHIMGIPEDINFTDWADLREKSAIVRMIDHPADDGCRALMRSLTDYMCEETIEGYEVLPPALDKRLTAGQKKQLTYGLMRSWAGDDICDQLHIPTNRLRHILPVARPIVRAYDAVTRLLPHDDAEDARRSLEAFGVALRLGEGEPELARPEEIEQDFRRHGPNADEILQP